MTAIPHLCRAPGCNARITEGPRCPKHRRAPRPDTRPSASARGYDPEWRRRRLAHLQKEPWCRECKATGRLTVATDVDHIKPRRFGGCDEEHNLQSLCSRCHKSVTVKYDGGFGREVRPKRAGHGA